MDGFIVLAVYGGIGILIIWLGILFYTRSVASRKDYVCPECHERITVELMEADRCVQCGARLSREMR